MEKYNITVKIRSMGNYLRRWGMTCQHPARKAYLQNSEKLDTFMNETYPDIVKKAKKRRCCNLLGR